MTHSKTQFPSPRHRAVTLIESMILMVIMSVIVLGTGISFQSLVDVPTSNNRALTITNLLVDKMERLKALGFTALSATANGSDSPVIDNITYSRSWTITLNPGSAYDANFVQFSVTIGGQTVTSAMCKP